MSNLKKILALVLALVMSFSLVTVSSAAYEDQDEIGADYLEAVTVLTNLGIFKGDNLGNFNPKAPITRQEVAAMMYRVISGDTADANDELYVDACVFEDGVATWAKGFVGYCANGGYVKGVGGPNFDPEGNISGIAVLAMILRAVGYDKNDEFTGAHWENNVLTVATDLGILSGIDETVGSLRLSATRELVAELIFRAMIKAPKVTYTPAFSYQPVVNTIGVNNLAGTQKATIGYDNFGLLTAQLDSQDKWGNPNHNWLIDVNENRTADATDLALGAIATIPYAAADSFVAPKTECEVAPVLGFKTAGENKVTTYENGKKGDSYVNAVDVINVVGAQGRLTNVYYYVSRETGLPTKVITHVDTLLARVENVVTTAYDAAGHRYRSAEITLTVFDGTVGGNRVTKSSTSNFNYVKGDMILVNAYQTNGIVDSTTGIVADYIVLNGVAESMVGAQSTIWRNAGKHTIGGVDYMDNNRFHLNEAGVELTNHTWYFDKNGNLIGATDIVSTNYAVLKNLIWVPGTPGYAQATLVDMNGAESTAIVAAIDGELTANTFAGYTTTFVPNYTVPGTQVGFVGTFANATNDLLYNTAYNGYGMYRVDTNLNGTVNLVGTNVITYVDDAKLAANGSAILDTNGAFVAAVNDATQYLIREVDAYGVVTYVPVTGTVAMASYSSADVFYVNYDGDNYADYVYLKNVVKAAATAALVYTTTASYSSNLTNGLGLSTIVATVNGKAGETLVERNNNALCNLLATNIGKLFVVTFNADGTMATATVIDELYTAPLTFGAAKVAYLPGGFTFDGMTLTNNAISYRADNAVVIGATDIASAIADGKALWVVYTDTIYNTAAYVYCGAGLSTSTALTSVKVKGVAATVDTNANDTIDYNVTIPNATAQGTALVLEAITANPFAEVAYFNGSTAATAVNPIAVTDASDVKAWCDGNNGEIFLKVTVTAQDGVTTNSYVIRVTCGTAATTGVISAIDAPKTQADIKTTLGTFGGLTDAEMLLLANQQAGLTVTNLGSGLIDINGTLDKNVTLKSKIDAASDYFIVLNFTAPAGFAATQAKWENNALDTLTDGVMSFVLCLPSTPAAQLARTITWYNAAGDSVTTSLVIDLTGVTFN